MDNIKKILAKVEWGKFLSNFLVFAGADIIIALVALESNVLPLFHSPAGAALGIVVINLVIDLLKKFSAANQKVNG